MTIYTFAERPGLAQVEAERMSQKAYAKGIKARMQTESGDTNLDVSLDGKFLKARMSPYYMNDQEGNALPYVLESYVDWGTYAEGGPPSLIRFYTSASHVDNDVEKAIEFSQNTFKFFMALSSENELQGFVHFAGAPLFNETVSFYDGNTGDILGEAITDEKGEVSLPVDASLQRAFGKVRRIMENPGMTIMGEEYAKVSYGASAFLEISDFMEEPKSMDDTASSLTSEYKADSFSTSSPKRTSSSSVGGYMLVSLAASVGAAIGTIVIQKLTVPHRHNQVASMETENLKIDIAERV